MKLPLLPYDPGPLPSRPAPKAGERLELAIDGWPPWKDQHFSIRNARSPQFLAFVALRQAAIQQMDGKAWYLGPVSATLVLQGPVAPLNKRIDRYAAGVADTLDGGHGRTFTYLPVVFEDDCQIVSWDIQFRPSPTPRYRLTFEFLPDSNEARPNLLKGG